jgi:hypothetical protein
MALEALDPNEQNQNATVTVQGADSSFDNAQAIDQGAIDQGALDVLAAPTYGSTQAISDWYKNEETGLGREADTAGLNYWSQQFGETLDPNEIELLQSSPEYQNRNFLTGLYENKLGREYDQPGYNYWMDSFNSGASRSQIEQNFNLSPEHQTSRQLSDLYNSYYGTLPDPGKLQIAKDMLAAGKTLDEVNDMYAADPAVAGNITKFLEGEYQENLGRAPDADGLEFWRNEITGGRLSLEEAEQAISASPEGVAFLNDPIVKNFQTYTGRLPDAEGLEYWRNELAQGKSADEIAREIAISQESINFNIPSVKAVLEATLGADIVNQLTPEQLAAYTTLYVDPSLTRMPDRVPVSFEDFDPDYYGLHNQDVGHARGWSKEALYGHYTQFGFNEGRAGNADPLIPVALSDDEKFQDIYKQIALDPVLGPKLKAENPMLWEQVTPLTTRMDEYVRTERTGYGQFGTVDIGGASVPILNANRADEILGQGNNATVSDFSHSRGNLTANLGWSSNSFSGEMARGANALGVTVTEYPEYDLNGNLLNTARSYSGLNEAAALVGVDPAQFKDKQVPATEPTDRYDPESGQLIARAGQQVYQRDYEGNVVYDYQIGQPVPAMRTITAESQLYDAIGEAAKNIYRYTGDSLTPGQGHEGGSKSFDTVFYKRVGDELIPISGPNSHGGQQNADVYRPKDFGFSYYAQGPLFVGTMALAMMTAGAATAAGAAAGMVAPATAIGTAVGAGAAAPIVGGIILGATLGGLNAAVSEKDIGTGALTGAVVAGISASMKPLMELVPMKDAIATISDASGNFYGPGQIASIIGTTLATTLGTAVSGANGDQILKAFATSLASNGISQTGVSAVTAALRDVVGTDMLPKLQRAIQIAGSTVATSALTGKNQEQIMNNLIAQFTDPNKLIGNVTSVVNANRDLTGGTGAVINPATGQPYTGSDQNSTVSPGGGTSTAGVTDGFTQAELDAINQGAVDAGTVTPGFETASTVTSDQPAPFVPKGEVSVSGFSQAAYDDAINKYGMSEADARAWASSGVGEVEITGVGENPAEDPEPFVPNLNVVLPEVYDIIARSQSSPTAGGALTTGGNTFVRGLPLEVIEAALADKNAPPDVKKKLEEEKRRREEERRKAQSGGGGSAVTSGGGDGGGGRNGGGDGGGDGGGPTDTGEIGTTPGDVDVAGPGGPGDVDVAGPTGAGTGPTGPTGTGTGPTGPTGTGTGPTGTGTGPTGPTGTGTGPTGPTGGTGPTGTGPGTGPGGTGVTPTRPATIPQMRAAKAAEETQGIYDLTPGLTKARTDYQLAGQFKMAAGGSVATQYDPFGLSTSTYGTSDNAGISDPSASPFVGSNLKMPKLRVGMTKRNVDYNLPGYNPKFMAEGGSAESHNPQFFSEGGLGTLENRYVNGEGNGTSDEVPAMLANGEFVIPADVVAALGNGSNEAGAGVLDQLLQVIREHKQDHDPEDLPPDSAGPLAYLLEAKKRA